MPKAITDDVNLMGIMVVASVGSAQSHLSFILFNWQETPELLCIVARGMSSTYLFAFCVKLGFALLMHIIRLKVK